MAFTDEEKERIRYGLGYLSVSPASALQFGQPRPVQTLFLVELAMNNIMSVAEDRVKRYLGVLDGIECRLVEALDRLAATSLDGLSLRADETDQLEKEYYRWASRIADVLGVPMYGNSDRFKKGGKKFGNINVVR
jgi:hypothetical protein